jgi:hypothetical protein
MAPGPGRTVGAQRVGGADVDRQQPLLGIAGVGDDEVAQSGDPGSASWLSATMLSLVRESSKASASMLSPAFIPNS